MQEPNDQTISLLVLEHGASWPTWGNQVREQGLNLVVEAQLPHESFADLEARVGHRLVREKEGGRLLVAAGYVCALDGSARGHDQGPEILLSDEMVSDSERSSWRLRICERLLDELEFVAKAGAADARNRGEVRRPGQLILGSGGWRGKPGETSGRARLFELWSRLSGQLPGKVVSLRFDESPSESGAFPAAGVAPAVSRRGPFAARPARAPAGRMGSPRKGTTSGEALAVPLLPRASVKN